jgi:hypothetical protein
MTPLKTFIAMIKRWQIIAALAFTLLFGVSTARHLGDALFSFVCMPVMLFALAFLFFASTTSRFNARQIFPSVLVVISVFVAVGATGAMLQIPDFPIEFAIFGGLIISLMASGLFVLGRPLCRKIDW